MPKISKSRQFIQRSFKWGTAVLHNKSAFALIIFIAAGVAGLVSDFGLGAWRGWKDAHTLTHFFFGLGFPFYWVTIFSSERKANRRSWQIAFDNNVSRHLGDGFWVGVSVTVVWSLWNEIIVYWVYNPGHPADWNHWVADHVGIMASYAILKAISRSNPGSSLPSMVSNQAAK